MMEYRKLPHGNENERFSTLGMGLGNIEKSSDSEIEQTISTAIEGGINFFDFCAGGWNVYAPAGRAIRSVRDNVFIQLHLGAVYNEKGAYGWSRNFDVMKKTFDNELSILGTDYADFGFLHCIDEAADFEKLIEIGAVDYLKELKKQCVIRHIGFSSHTPSVAAQIIDTGLVDMMMFSINPAYDFEQGGAGTNGTVSERTALFHKCETDGIGISVMKPFLVGKLMNENDSPFGHTMTTTQCISYALDRPGVLTTVPGIRNIDDLESLLYFTKASREERDYSFLGSLTAENVRGKCVYCSHCHPCPMDIDIALVNKYYDLAKAGDQRAFGHYEMLSVNADACISCGHCDERCPFHVNQSDRMAEIAEYFHSSK